MVFNFKANEKVCSVACIVSREVNKVWKRSFAQMVVSESAIAGHSTSLLAAINTSLTGVVVPLTSGNQYLNNAGTGGTQSTDSGSGESEQDQEQEGPIFDNSVTFTGNGSNATQSVAGGDVSVVGPLTRMVFSAINGNIDSVQVLDENEEVIGTKNFADGILTWNGNIAVGQNFFVNKVVNGTETQWFSGSVIAASAGGDGADEN